MQTLSVPGKGRGPKTATKKLRKSKCPHFTHNREESFLLPRPPLLLLHSQLGENACPNSGQQGQIQQSWVLPRPIPPPATLQGLWEPQPKSQGLLNTEGKNQNPTPGPRAPPSPAKQFRYKPPPWPLLQNFKSPNRRSPGTSPLLPKAP